MISRGSEWRRWDPHIHTPGTVLNDQFGGTEPWEAFLNTIENTLPKIEAIAVTDYYVTDSYEELRRRAGAGRIPGVSLIMPNIELRLDVAAKSGFVNIHLLVSPEDEDHVEQVQRILKRLGFRAFDDRFDCTRDELIRLGRRSNPTLTHDRAALEHGATQFKVNFNELREVFGQSEWAKNNVLIAVAGTATDGTSGLRQAADATIREEIEKFAHVIFASSVAQREFWLGQRSASVEALRERYGGCKPCLHGSDAHDQASVGQPTDDRYSWIKGALTFDALRQACIDPGGRAYVGSEPPPTAIPSQVISRVAISNATWAATPDIPLNSGLVAIIGARGSGKTALADIIAAGCDAISNDAWKADDDISPSFLVRARSVIGDAKATLTWGGGASVTRALNGRDANDPLSFKRARYLSQQFVEELCSSKGASDGLIREIERVIFEAHSAEEREGALNFNELRDHRIRRHHQARQREAEAISDISEHIGDEMEKENLAASLVSQVAQKKSLIESYTTDRAKLMVKATPAQIARHNELNTAVQAAQSKLQQYQNQKRTFLALQDEVRSMRATKAPELLRQTQGRHPASGLDTKMWDEFLLVYQGNVDDSLAGYLRWVDDEIAKISGVPLPLATDPNAPVIPDGTELRSLQLSQLRAEMARLEALFSADNITREKYAALSTRITQETANHQNLQTRLTDAQGAAERRKQLQTDRDAAYERVFDAIVAEQKALTGLYEPLMAKLASASGTLGKLSFSVTRTADAHSWGNFAEDSLIDCRKSGPFYGRGKLIALANTQLKPIWELGNAGQVHAAMTAFIASYWKDIVAHAPYAPTEQLEFRAWSKNFAHWLFGTGHIAVQYEMAYDGIDIRKLSPGTRGIVLLLLYLALDDADDRPLIIDQPEENLDPKSVFDELVSLFIKAKSRRQVIMVTHNANLVVNTDADQIIVAEAGAHESGGLPSIWYKSGGLEDVEIRKAVCDILEGGEMAFRERARRMRVRLER